MDIKLKFVNWFNFSILLFQCCWFMLLLLKPSPFLIFQIALIAVAYGLCMFDQYQMYKNGRDRLNIYKEIYSYSSFRSSNDESSGFKDLENENFPYFLNPNNWLIAVYEIKLPESISEYLAEQWDMVLWCEEETEFAVAFINHPNSSSILFQSKDDAVKFILRWGSEL